MIIAGIDNGATGSIGLMNDNHNEFWKTPKIRCQTYQKSKRVRSKKTGLMEDKYTFLNRINVVELYDILRGVDFAAMERPMVNPGRWNATVSALRAHEATLGVLEQLSIKVLFVDSKEWQSVLLPGIVGTDELKKASMELGIKLYPEHEELIRKQKDADGLLIAHWYKEYKLKE